MIIQFAQTQLVVYNIVELKVYQFKMVVQNIIHILNKQWLLSLDI